MNPLLSGDAGGLDIVLEEGSRWLRDFLHLVDEAVDETGEPEPFDPGTTAWLTMRYSLGGPVLVEMGPAAEDLHGTVLVDAAQGVISCDLPPLASIGLDFPAQARGVWDLVIYPGGEEDEAYRLLEGFVTFRRRSTYRPAAP